MWERMHVPCASPHAFHLCFRKVNVYLMLSHLPGRHRVGKTLCEGWHSGPVEGRSVIFTILWAVRNGYVTPPQNGGLMTFSDNIMHRPHPGTLGTGGGSTWRFADLDCRDCGTTRPCQRSVGALAFDCMEKNGTVGIRVGKIRDSWGTSKRSEAWNTKGRRKHGRFWLFFYNCLGWWILLWDHSSWQEFNFWSRRFL